MKNIHLLPTDKPSRLCFRYYLFINKDNIGTYSNVEFKNIYITNSEEIKEGDWYYWTVTNSVQKAKKDNLKRLPKISDGSHKIILTTDQDLIKDGVQAIDDEFLEWFVKNPSCEIVEVDRDEREVGNHLGGIVTEYGDYKIIIPQEEPKQELHICKYCNVETTQSDDECYAKPKQESVETDKTNWKVVYEDSLNMQKCSNAGYESKIQELKQEIERMYSEEEVLELIWKYETRKTSMVGYGNVKKWFEQFKKK
jgi:hypothetical protein